MNTLAKKLLYKSWNRGCKETDILLGEFARAKVEHMNEAELDSFSVIVEASDELIYAAIVGRIPIPIEFDKNLFQQIIDFNSERVR